MRLTTSGGPWADQAEGWRGAQPWPARRRGRTPALAGSEVGQHLPVDGDARRLHSAYELRVGEAVLARSRVDPDDPQAAEVALLVLAADERVLLPAVSTASLAARYSLLLVW